MVVLIEELRIIAHCLFAGCVPKGYQKVIRLALMKELIKLTSSFSDGYKILSFYDG